MTYFPIIEGTELIVAAMPRSASTLTKMIIDELILISGIKLNVDVTHAFMGSEALVRELNLDFNDYIQGKINKNEYSIKTNKIRNRNAEKEIPVIICIRDVFDCCVSYNDAMRNWLEESKKNNIKTNRGYRGIKDFMFDYVTHLSFYNYQMMRGRKTWVFRYEDYNSKEGLNRRVFDLASVLNVNISKEKIIQIAEKFSIENNKKIIKKQKHFGEWDKKTRLHGDHIGKYNGASGLSNRLINEKEKISLFYENTDLAKCLLSFGYSHSGAINPLSTLVI